MDSIEITLAERGQVVIPKAARDALGLKPGAKLQLRIEAGRLLIEKKTKLDLSRWAGKAADEPLTTHQVIAELRGRPVPWQVEDEKKAAKPSPSREKKSK
jgi:AbrB family looped-hinge helix DNA binding protein